MKLKRLKNFKSEEGSSLVLILLLLSVLIILGASLSRTSVFQFQTSVREERKLQAQYIAKSGANMVAGAIQNGIVDPAELDNKVSSPFTLNNGQFVVNVSDNSSTVTITSTATVDNISETITLELSRITTAGNLPSLDHAVFADTLIHFTSGSPAITGDIGVNSTGVDAPGVIIDGNPSLYDDIYIGQGANPEDVVQIIPDNYTGFHGDINILPEEQEYLLPEYPVFPDDLSYHPGTYTAGYWPPPPFIINSSGWYEKIEVLNELTIDIYDEDIIIRANEFHVLDNGKININRHGSGKLKLYVDNDFKLTGGSTLNNNGNPEDVYMYYSGENITIGGNTKFVGSAYIEKANMEITGSGGITGNITNGGGNITISGDASANVRAIYAPQSDIVFNGSGHVRGAVVGDTVEMDGGTYVDYDDSMQNIDFAELGFEVTEGFSRTWK